MKGRSVRDDADTEVIDLDFGEDGSDEDDTAEIDLGDGYWNTIQDCTWNTLWITWTTA